MQKLTEDQEKIDLVSKLVKEGVIKYDNNDSITAQKYKITCGLNFN